MERNRIALVGMRSAGKTTLAKQRLAPDLAADSHLGCWDIGLLFDERMQKLDESMAVKNIQRTITELHRLYDRDSTLTVTESTGPQDILKALNATA